MEELIRRSDAIKAFCMDCRGRNEPCEHSDTCKTMKVLRNRKNIPAVEPWDLYDCDEWCIDCKEYDTKHHTCPRWNRVIRNMLEENKVVNCCGCIHWIDGKCEKLKMPTEDFFFCGWGEREGADDE